MKRVMHYGWGQSVETSEICQHTLSTLRRERNTGAVFVYVTYKTTQKNQLSYSKDRSWFYKPLLHMCQLYCPVAKTSVQPPLHPLKVQAGNVPDISVAAEWPGGCHASPSAAFQESWCSMWGVESERKRFYQFLLLISKDCKERNGYSVITSGSL